MPSTLLVIPPLDHQPMCPTSTPRSGGRLAQALLGLIATLVGCTAAPHIEIRGMTEDGEPLVGVEVTVLPFDAERLLDSLRTVAPHPQPDFPALAAAIAAYQPPDWSAFESSGAPWVTLRDSVQSLADSLIAAERGAPGYAQSYGRLEAMYQRLALRTAERDASLRDRIGAQRRLALEAAAAADSLRQWERTAYQNYAALAESAMARAGRTGHRLLTGPDGRAVFSPEPGQWWVMARWPDPANPFREYVWNVPMLTGPLGPRRVPLPLAMAQSRWRH